MSDQATIKKLISSNRIKEAFDALKNALPQENGLVTLEFQWNALRREEMMGTIGFSDKTVRSNQIISTLLAFCDLIGEEGAQAAQSESLVSENSATSNPPSPVSNTTIPKKIFFSYSKYDREYLEQLTRHLAVLRRKGKIAAWDDHQILPGEEWDDAIKDELNHADIILLLISSDFLATDYIWDVEIKTAMDRHAQKSAQVIPIVLRPCSWEDAPFGKLNGLPSKAKPVSSYSDRDQAWLEVVKGIERLV